MKQESAGMTFIKTFSGEVDTAQEWILKREP